MTNRFFRTDNDELYEQIRLGLDATWNHIPPTTCIEPAETAPRDKNNNIILAVKQEFTEFEAVQQILPDLLNSGSIIEITEEEYMSSIMMPLDEYL